MIRKNAYFQPTPEQITAFVAKHFECKPRKNDTELRICNPFSDDTGFHFSIGTVRGQCHDWRSDTWAGPPSRKTNKRNTSFVHFVQLYLNCTYRDAIKAICAASDSTIPSLRASGRPDISNVVETPLVTLPPLSQSLLASNHQSIAHVVLNWLARRGVDNIAVKLYNIHHATMDVVWPYYEYGQLVYWQSRSIISKSFNFPKQDICHVSKGQWLYNFDNIEPAQDLYITEAIFGCMTLIHQTGATGGASLMPDQIKKIKLLGPRLGVTLASDNDLAGLKSVVHNGDMLAQRGFKVYYSLPPRIEFVEDGVKHLTKDWNELITGPKLGHAEIWKIMQAAIKPYNIINKLRLMSEIGDLDCKKSKKLPANIG